MSARPLLRAKLPSRASFSLFLCARRAPVVVPALRRECGTTPRKEQQRTRRARDGWDVLEDAGRPADRRPVAVPAISDPPLHPRSYQVGSARVPLFHPRERRRHVSMRSSRPFPDAYEDDRFNQSTDKARRDHGEIRLAVAHPHTHTHTPPMRRRRATARDRSFRSRSFTSAPARRWDASRSSSEHFVLAYLEATCNFPWCSSVLWYHPSSASTSSTCAAGPTGRPSPTTTPSWLQRSRRSWRWRSSGRR